MQVETLTSQRVRRVCTADSVSALASDPHTERADPAGLAWYAAVLTCAASIRGGDIWYWLSVSRRMQALQHGTGSIIADCVVLVSWAAGRAKSQETPL